MTDFVALYRGRTVAEAELVAVSAEQRLVHRFFAELLGKPEPTQETGASEKPQTVLQIVPDDEE